MASSGIETQACHFYFIYLYAIVLITGFALKVYHHIQNITRGTIGHTYIRCKMKTFWCSTRINNITQNALVQHTRWNMLTEVTLAKIATIELLSSPEQTQMHNIVIINIVHLNPIIIIRGFRHFVRGRIHLNIPMIMVFPINHDRIFLYEFSLVERLGPRSLEITQIRFICRLNTTHHITILVLEHKQVRCLLHNDVFSKVGTMQHQRVMDNLEINRLRSTIRIENRVTYNPKSRLFLIIVKPKTLQHLLS